jgi:RNA polymerase sporulation-specific sigma factor
MDFYKELNNTNFDELFDRLVAYASFKLKTVNIRVMDGKQPCDLVAELLEKVIKGIRNAETANCSLDEFLFGCLRSDIDAFFSKNKISPGSVGENTAITDSPVETPKQLLTSKEHHIAKLREVGADEEEISVFNIWAEGITKPFEVGTELGLSSKAIYKIQRRLFKHLEGIRKKSKIFV